MSKVFVFGIDGAMPEKVFGEWLDELPNIRKLMEQGCYAKLNSTIPPLSIVAWMSIITGKPPAEHGIFECLYREKGSYEFSKLFASHDLKEKTIWEIVSEQNKKAISCFVPLTWPVKPFEKGKIISGFMTPQGPKVEFAYPKELKEEINQLLKEPLLIDVKEFRELTKEDIIKQVHKVTQMHIDSIAHLLKKEEWDLFFAVINGSDRINHSFWKYEDKEHRKYNPDSKYKNVLKNYYKFLDTELGKMVDSLDDETTVILLSDHGINRMHNRVNISDWLIKEGYLVLKEDVKIESLTKLTSSMIDWRKTRVFSFGFLEGQIFINLKGREQQGIVSEEDYGELIEELEEKIKKIPGDDGKILNTKIFKKKDYFKGEYESSAPDMVIYFDDLQYGCNPTQIGNPTLWSPSTGLWSDDAGHSRQGIFIMNKSSHKGYLGEISYLDIAPTILNRLELDVPEDVRGEILE